MEKNHRYCASIFKKVFNITNCGVILVDGEGEIKGTNQQALNILNIWNERNISKEIERKAPQLCILIKTCLSNKNHVTNKHLRIHSTELYVNISYFGSTTEPEGLICTFQDASRIEQIAGKIESDKQIRHRMESFINTSFDGIWIVDHNGIVLCVNKASEELHKLKAENVVGMNIYDIADRGMVEKTISNRVLKTKKKISELTQIHGRQVLATGSPVMDEQGDISFVLVNERDMTELRALREEIENSRMKVDKFQEELKKINDLEHEQYGIIAESHSMLSVLQTCRKLAQLEVSNILIRGESGTGKGMIAQYVHQNSKRSEKPFIQVNCAAIPETLMEAELFGYEKGAFTGARLQGKAGLIELAHGGTLFLDEIGDMPLQLQAKLLKYLDDKQFRRVGGVKLHEVDCILLTATNRDLEKLSAKKKFRKDLFYRLSSFPIKLPSLNERPEDIPPLAAHFIEQFNQKYNLKRKATPSALLQLQTHHYHGNARELRNMVKKAVILNETDLIDNIIKFNEPGKESSGFSEVAETISGQLTLKERLRAVEKDFFV
jgi:PAS domain S-box-containing protein